MSSSPVRALAGRHLHSWLSLPLLACLGCNAQSENIALLRARSAEELGQTRWARHYYAEDVRVHATRLPSFLALAKLHLEGEGDLQIALDAARSARELAPESSEVARVLARAHHALGDSNQALSALSERTGEAATHVLRAELLLQERPADALLAARAADREEPTAATARLIGAALLHLDRFEEAGDPLRRSVREAPLVPATYYLIARRARNLGDEKGAAEALASYEQVLRVEQALSGQTATGTSRAPAHIRSLRQSSGLPPGAYERLLVLEHEATPGFPESSALADRLLDDAGVDLSVPHWLRLARNLARRRDLDRALTATARAIELSPTDRRAALTKVELLIEKGRLDRASTALDELSTAESTATIHFYRGLLALERGDEAGAVTPLEQAVRLAPWKNSYRERLRDVLLSLGELSRLDSLPQDPADTSQ